MGKDTPVVKAVTEVDTDFVARLDQRLERIEGALQNMKLLNKPEFLTTDEFMSKVKVSRWKLDILLSSGSLKYKKIGRKIYIQSDQVEAFFRGELQ